VPDNGQGVQYWRDPLVVSTSPAGGSTGPAPGAVTVKFERDVQPTGADYSGSVTVTGPSGAVAGTVSESDPGTLVWTPSAAPAAGSYTVTVAQVSSTGSAGLPITKPYTFTFTVS
jgi:hypothetical protein